MSALARAPYTFREVLHFFGGMKIRKSRLGCQLKAMYLKQTFVFKWKLAVILMGFYFVACMMKPANPSPRIQFGGWVTYWDFKRGMENSHQGKTVYRDIFLFSAQLNADGTPFVVNSKTIDYRSAIDQLKTSGVKTWMTFVNDVRNRDAKQSILKDPQLVHTILKDKTLRLKHRREIIDLALKYGVSGVDIDYENLLPEDRAYFSRFIAELSADLKKLNLSLSITVQPKTLNRPALKNSAMDWSEVCRHADRLQIMLYNLHGKKTAPGPLATIDWISDVLGYAKNQCKQESIVPILKVSGMHWKPNKVTAIHYGQVIALKNKHKSLLKRDKTSQVPFFSYKINGDSGVVYFEDATSLKIKIYQIHSLGFNKIVFWSLGRQDPQLASELKDFL